jgi:hypothetical protein
MENIVSKRFFQIVFDSGLFENPCFSQFGRQRTIFAEDGGFFWIGGEEFYRLKLTIFRLIVLMPFLSRPLPHAFVSWQRSPKNGNLENQPNDLRMVNNSQKTL